MRTKEVAMRTYLQVSCVLAAALAAAPAASAAGASQDQKIAAMQYLVGTWNCTHTVGSFSGTYKTTWSNAVGNRWLKQTYDFPPRQMSENDRPEQGEWLVGYDEARQAWVRFGVMSTGQYFAIRMTETPTGWAWKYVSFFKRSKPETPGSDATFTKRSDTEYVVDGPTYPKDGTGPLVTEHHVCKKQ
jgi:hypothetical protein